MAGNERFTKQQVPRLERKVIDGRVDGENSGNDDGGDDDDDEKK